MKLKKSELRNLISQVISEQRAAPAAPMGGTSGTTGKPNVSPAGFQGQSREEEEKPKGRGWRFLGELLHAIADAL